MSCCGDGGAVTPINTKPVKAKNGLQMTKEASDYVKSLLKKEGQESWGLKIEVAPGGCAGYKYFMGFQEKAADGEKTFDVHGQKIFLSDESLGLIDGSTIEFISSLEATGLKVNNPNATRACACGKSFS
mgnify:CR=1 FL=1